MGLFSRLGDIVSGLFGSKTQNVDFGDDRLNDIWNQLEGEVSRGQRDSFIDDAIDSFRTGYVEGDVEHDERIAAREQFEALCGDYSVNIEDFDWAEWRDWYLDQSA